MPQLYLNPDYFRQIRGRIDAKEPTICEAWNDVRNEADSLGMVEDPIRIGDNGGYRDFRSDVTYVKDGVIHPEANHESVHLLNKVSQRTLNLALAYQVSGDAKYADRALVWIHRWCIDQDSYMFPDGIVVGPFTPGLRPGGDVGIFLRGADLFLACYLLDSYPGWGLAQRAAVKRWVVSMIKPHRELMFYNGYAMYNNWEDARLCYLIKAALFLHDVELMIGVFRRWKETIPLKMTTEGELPRETERTRSMTYTLAALGHTIEIAEIARQCGEPMHDFEAEGKCLKTAVDYATHYLLNIKDWPFELIKPIEQEIKGKPGCLFYLARRLWGETSYQQVLDRWWPESKSRGEAALLFS